LADLVRHLASLSIDVWVEEHTAIGAELNGFNTAKLEDIGAKADLAIVMGGDGTMLSVARNLMDAGIPLVGINRGRFGFLTDLRAEDMLDSIDAILAGAYRTETRMMMTASVLREGKTVYDGLAFNDVVIKSGLRLIELSHEEGVEKDHPPCFSLHTSDLFADFQHRSYHCLIVPQINFIRYEVLGELQFLFERCLPQHMEFVASRGR
jgi:hypothetical protein